MDTRKKVQCVDVQMIATSMWMHGQTNVASTLCRERRAAWVAIGMGCSRTGWIDRADLDRLGHGRRAKRIDLQLEERVDIPMERETCPGDKEKGQKYINLRTLKQVLSLDQSTSVVPFSFDLHAAETSTSIDSYSSITDS